MRLHLAALCSAHATWGSVLQLVDISKRLKRAKETRIYSEQLAGMGLSPEGKKL